MRHPYDKCLLCRENDASQKNSHIIPKLFGQGLFYGTKPRHSIGIDRTGSKRKVQDIAKEDYLLCPNCEKGFSIYESYCSAELDRLNKIRYFNDFSTYKVSDFEFRECKRINLKVFNLFIYSIIWRLSVCNSYAFASFKLSDPKQEELRAILKKFSKPTQSLLMGESLGLNNLPSHSHVLVRPRKILRPPNSMLSAHSYNESLHQIHLVDYVLIYTTLRNMLPRRFEALNNNRLDGFVRVGMIEKDNWKQFNNKMVLEAFGK